MIVSPSAQETSFRDPPAPSGDAGAPFVAVVVPVYDAMRFLPRTVPPLLAAARRFGRAELRFVDNGSTDGSYEYLRSIHDESVTVEQVEGGTIAALRNHGAARAVGTHLAFVDADCVVPETYLDDAVAALHRTGAAATGFEVHAPEPGGWIETAWHRLHYVPLDREVHYLNAANFFVSRDAFREVGGFDEELATGEDAEICRRITEAGGKIYACSRVRADHLGNPRTVREFFRRTVWHGLGMFGTVGGRRLDRPTAMLAVHLLATACGLALLAAARMPMLSALALALGLQLLAPAATVAFRVAQARDLRAVFPGLFLYWLYYWARLQALVLIAAGRTRSYRK